MRIYLTFNQNDQLIPFNYQPLLTGCLHKWIGSSNAVHGKTSLYSFSWLQNVKTSKKGILLGNRTSCFFSFYDEQLAKKVIQGIIDQPELFEGSSVQDVSIRPDPIFSGKETFWASSPIFIKRPLENGKEKHYSFQDEESNQLMTQTLKTKLKTVGLPDKNVSVKFDISYTGAKTKVVPYNKINNKANICPVIVEGSPEQIAFAWNVGIGNSTGIGFGSLK